jgi:hypothetical protein
MKTITRLLGLFAVAAMFIFLDACKAEKGEVGPAGATGAVGATGATGAKGDKGDKGDTGAVGATGNANVIQVSYTSRTHTGSDLQYSLPTNITKAIFDNSAYFVYVSNTSGNTYALPGWCTGGSNSYRTYTAISSTIQSIYIGRVAGSGSDIFNTTRIVIVPANDLRTGRKAAVDYTDYEAVKAFYHLKD